MLSQLQLRVGEKDIYEKDNCVIVLSSVNNRYHVRFIENNRTITKFKFKNLIPARNLYQLIQEYL